jgi:hypothetical protein
MKLIFIFISQLQVGLQANVPQPSEDDDAEDDVDAALTDLQGGRGGDKTNNLNTPTLCCF